MMNLLRLSFVPQSVDLGLLILRVSMGLSMLILHGWDKFQNFSAKAPGFMRLFDIVPSNISLGMAIFAEVVCSVLLIVGFFTRFAALNLAITMAVAFFIQHKGVLSGPGSGELALVYLIGFATLVFAGGGKYAADGK
ncbi:DoxX family protein [Prosthecobacter algae]